MSDLEQQLVNARLALKSDGYQMSIGELASLYENGELSIDPAFQRNLRWNAFEKVAFIESILMQFPLPSIFVAATHDGKWDLLDGLQRMTAVFEFMGILRNSDGNHVPPLALQGTERFPELNGVLFRSDNLETPQLSDGLRLDFKRQRMDVKIILRESDAEMKYDLFLRLATGGTPLSPQDARNAVMANVDSAFRTWTERLAQEGRYLETLWLSDSDLRQRYNEELFLIFLLAANDDEIELKEAGDLDGGLAALLTRLVRSPQTRLYNYDRELAERMFFDIFDLLADRYHEKAFEQEGGGQASVGLRRDAFIAITSAMALAWTRDKARETLDKVGRYWEERPKFATFSDAVLWGRALGSQA